jgi:EpsI family protein
MKALRIKALLLSVLMLASAAMAQLARPTIKIADRGPKVDLEALFPAAFGDWRVDERMAVILPAPDVQAKLDAIYNQVLSRAYVNAKGERVMLSVAYGGDQSDGTSAHRPEVCYTAQGFQVLANEAGRVAVDGRAMPVRHLVTRLGPRFEPITYWIVVGDEVVTSGTQQKLAQLRYGLRGEIPDGMLVRVSSIGNDATAAYALQSGFVNDLVRSVEPAARSRVVGD